VRIESGPGTTGPDGDSSSHGACRNPLQVLQSERVARGHKWRRHFAWDGPILVRRPTIGRTTIAVLHINDPVAVEHRQSLIEETGDPT
jgi:hypothetical protein